MIAPPGPWFTNVSGCAADMLPAVTCPKSSDVWAGDHASTGTAAVVPCPLNATCVGELLALLVMASEPVVGGPAVDGAKVMPIVQVACGARLAAQDCVSTIAKPAPATDSKDTANAVLPVLVNVIVRAG